MWNITERSGWVGGKWFPRVAQLCRWRSHTGFAEEDWDELERQGRCWNPSLQHGGSTTGHQPAAIPSLGGYGWEKPGDEEANLSMSSNHGHSALPGPGFGSTRRQGGTAWSASAPLEWLFPAVSSLPLLLRAVLSSAGRPGLMCPLHHYPERDVESHLKCPWLCRR